MSLIDSAFESHVKQRVKIEYSSEVEFPCVTKLKYVAFEWVTKLYQIFTKPARTLSTSIHFSLPEKKNKIHYVQTICYKNIDL